MPDAVENVVILGSGPAGLTAAVYTARANLRPIVIEGAVMGGQLMTTTDVENYPGFPKGILGPELMELMHQQAERFETRFIRGDVTAVNVRERPFTVTTDDGQTLKTKTLVVATGASAMYMGFPRRKPSWATGSPPAPPATASSSRGRRSWWSAAATRPWRRPPS